MYRNVNIMSVSLVFWHYFIKTRISHYILIVVDTLLLWHLAHNFHTQNHKVKGQKVKGKKCKDLRKVCLKPCVKYANIQFKVYLIHGAKWATA